MVETSETKVNEGASVNEPAPESSTGPPPASATPDVASALSVSKGSAEAKPVPATPDVTTTPRTDSAEHSVEALPKGLGEASPSSPLPREEEKTPEQDVRNKRLFIGGCIAVALIVLFTLGIFLFSQKKAVPTQQVLQPPTKETKPSPLKEEVLARNQWSFEVLNGSGVTGEAARIATKLESLGYVVVKIGNADKQTYETNQLFLSKETPSQKDLLLKDLKRELSISTISGELTDATASARIIVGKNQD